MRKKRNFLRRFFVLLIAVFAIWYFNNFTVAITEQAFYSEKIDEEIKIVLLADLHAYDFGNNNSGLLKKVERQGADLIFVLGDMYTSNSGKEEAAIDFCRSLTEYAPTYFVSGDHDYADAYLAELEQSGVHVLDFEKEDIEVNGNRLSLYGIRSQWFSPTFDLNNAFEPSDSGRVNILLAHCPMMRLFESFDLDFVFSADTHGGNIRLPFIGPLYYNGSFLPRLSYSGEIYDKGSFTVGTKQLFVTSGLGNFPLPLRWNNRPEIAVITLSGE